MTIGSACAQESLSSLRNHTQSSLRTFLETLAHSPSSPQNDSLTLKVSNLVMTTKSDTNSNAQKFLIAFFDQATQSLKAAKGTDAVTIQRFLNADLELKMSAMGDTVRHFLPFEKMFEEEDLTVNVYINGQKPSANMFTLYWFNFNGSKREPMILNNVFIRSSKDFKNPCPISVILPGYITFWVKDTASNYYECVQDYYVMDKKDENKTIQINFKPVN